MAKFSCGLQGAVRQELQPALDHCFADQRVKVVFRLEASYLSIHVFCFVTRKGRGQGTPPVPLDRGGLLHLPFQIKAFLADA